MNKKRIATGLLEGLKQVLQMEVDELELKRIEAKQKLAELQCIKIEAEYLYEMLRLVDDAQCLATSNQLLVLIKYLDLKK